MNEFAPILMDFISTVESISSLKERLRKKYIDGNDKISVYSTVMAESEKAIRRKQ
jgi:hypothetical protein